MFIRSTLLLVLFAAFFSQAILVQSLENVLVDPPQPDTDAKNKPETRDDRLRSDPPCGKDEIPLFNNHCVSRSAYTGIFLTSIILAGLSFLMLITLVILYFVRLRKGGLRDNDAESIASVRSNASSSSKSSASSVETVDRTRDERLPTNNRQQFGKSNPNNNYYVLPESTALAAGRAPVRGGGAVQSTPNSRAAASRPPPVDIDEDSAF